ncbi:SurA N-terminal domain-containing protein [Nocardioides sp. AX2bis]|uniref:SurA N-terminal domain-containing protein n=1 Tax=Nocardioides sp. AX2bis TaxID=2653157 RepID=UPI0013597A78|nr:SurA N-terminal domain-containing protein [Nocardioides sp. AX2bis]
MPTRTTLAGLAAALLLLTACGGGGEDEPSGESSASSDSSESAAAEPEGSEPDAADVPEVVAEVNGEEITRDEFTVAYAALTQQATAQAQAGGAQPDEDTLKEQTAQNLVDTELLRQEADARGIDASEQAVDDEITSLAEQNQLPSAQAFLDAVAEQGTSEDVVRDQVETQLLVEGLVADEAGQEIEPTEKDLRTLYQQVKQQQSQSGQQATQAIPPFDQVRAQLKDQAVSEEQGRVAQSLVDGLTEDADITINL